MPILNILSRREKNIKAVQTKTGNELIIFEMKLLHKLVLEGEEMSSGKRPVPPLR